MKIRQIWSPCSWYSVLCLQQKVLLADRFGFFQQKMKGGSARVCRSQTTKTMPIHRCLRRLCPSTDVYADYAHPPMSTQTMPIHQCLRRLCPSTDVYADYFYPPMSTQTMPIYQCLRRLLPSTNVYADYAHPPMSTQTMPIHQCLRRLWPSTEVNFESIQAFCDTMIDLFFKEDRGFESCQGMRFLGLLHMYNANGVRCNLIRIVMNDIEWNQCKK
jgi:hypothetical protein